MNGLGQLGVLLVVVGFLTVGFAALYSANVTPASSQDAAQIAKSMGTAQGVGWIAAGIGLAMAFLGVFMDLQDVKTVIPDISALNTSPPSSAVRKVPKVKSDFVCSDCGGDVSKNDKACPHCGAAIEGE
jgi:hypothetical protein